MQEYHRGTREAGYETCITYDVYTLPHKHKQAVKHAYQIIYIDMDQAEFDTESILAVLKIPASQVADMITAFYELCAMKS